MLIQKFLSFLILSKSSCCLVLLERQLPGTGPRRFKWHSLEIPLLSRELSQIAGHSLPLGEIYNGHGD